MSRRSGRETGSHNGPASSAGDSVASHITSASVLCGSNKFDTWATLVQLDKNVNLSIPSHEAFQDLRELKGLSNRFPAWLGDKASRSGFHAYICEADSGGASELVKYRNERELKVPQVQCGKYNVEKTKADGVMYLDVPDFGPYQHIELNTPATAFLQKGFGDNLYVVHCVAEFKREEDGSNQGMMGMVSGLYQRAVLQMPGQFVFGVLHSEKVLFKVVAGIWQGDKIRLYEIGSYNLVDPIAALRFYLVVRGIQRLGSSYEQELRSSAEALSAQVMNNPPSREWHPPRVGSIGEDLNEDQQPPHQGGTNTQQETPGQQRARHKVQSYLENTSSISEFLPVDRPPTPPIDLPSAETSP
ncbi:unnamed protein product [Rhizoctonia solani]|uniref:Uncharacterized protein n=1 Tax=Rhizoctonia solani TaxID=456999 RepID=A0A8H2WE41_9AGAM|nr:unnamed protein product [Rhizoctonia solani]